MRWVVVLAMYTSSTLAFADQTTDRQADARRLGEAALRRLDDSQDYAGASDLFLRAYETSHELPYLINVAVTQRKAKLPHQAVATYRRCLAEGGAALTADLRAQIESDIETVTRESAQLLVRTEGAAADVLLDDRRVGRASKSEHLLVLIAPDAGRVHSLRAQRPGFRDARLEIEKLSIGAPADIELVLSPIPTTGKLSIDSTPSGATIEKFGRAPLTVELPPGDYTIWGTLPGHERTLQNARVVAGETSRVTLALRALPPPSWWQHHRFKVYVGIGILALASGAIIARQAFEPNYGQRFDYP